MLFKLYKNFKLNKNANNQLISLSTLALKHKNEYKSLLIKNLLTKSIDANVDHLSARTLERLESCSIEFVVNLIKNLNDIGFKDKQLATLLESHDDLSLLTRSKLIDMYDMFRNLSLRKELFLATATTNPLLLHAQKDKLDVRMKELKKMFTNNHLDKLLVKTSRLLTDDLNNIIYKFTYVFALMSITQEDMCASRLFSHPMSHIRERHLFLLRSGFYDRPNKKGISKVKNPKLYQMVDTDLSTYLDVCTNKTFKKHDYETFCEYLKEEEFDNELLGYRIGKQLQDQVVKSIRDNRYQKYKED